jgi:predicted DNA-binding transcriptional regulator AlpA
MLMTLKDLMTELKLSRSTIYRIIKCNGFPPPYKIGRSTRWLKKEVEAYFKSQELV